MSAIDSMSNALLGACGLEPGDDAGVTGLLNWMERSAVGRCVSETPAGFYILLAFHSIGLAVVVGVMLVVCLRLLGRVQGLSVEVLPRLVRIGWYGFWLNAVSGAILFIGEPNKMVQSGPFLVKIALVAVGMWSTTVMNRTLLLPAAAGDAGRLSSSSARMQAYLSILIWLAVIAAGRLIAYVDVPQS